MTAKKYVCIICPNGCEIEAHQEGKDIRVAGNACKKGEEYVKKEMLAPERGLTSTVLVRGGKMPLVSVKASRPIPKDKVPEAVRHISAVSVNAPVKIGDVIVKNVLGTGADIVATKNVPKQSMGF